MRILLIGLCIWMWGNVGIAQDKLIIEGKINGAKKQWVYFEKFELNKPVKVDSTLTKGSGKFRLETTQETLNFCRISLSPVNSLMLMAQNGDAIQIEAESHDLLSTAKVSGSKDTDILLSFFRQEREFSERNSNVQEAHAEAQKNQDVQQVKAVEADRQQLNKDYRDFILGFIGTNASSPSVLPALGKLKIESDFDAFKTVRDSMRVHHPKSEYTLQLNKMVDQVEAQVMAKRRIEAITAIGAVAPEIVGVDTAGNPIQLSDLRGQYVLIDFWASWCMPCRMENPNVKKMYDKYHDAGFTVFSVSLDNKSSRWVKAIDMDGMTWMHVSDLKGWKSEHAKLYGVSSIPFTVLIDKEGRIIAKNLRGEHLQQQLSSIFGF